MIAEEIMLPWFHYFFKRLRKDLMAYENEEDLWLLSGDAKNSAGTLALHLAGVSKHFVGAGIAQNGMSGIGLRNSAKEMCREKS